MHHCYHSNNQLIIHTLIFKIQQILESHELKDHCHLWIGPPKKSLNQFLAFLNLYQHAKNQYARDSREQTGHIHFWLCSPKKNFEKLLIFVRLYQHAKKISLFHLFVLQTQLILKSHHMIANLQFWPCQSLKPSS